MKDERLTNRLLRTGPVVAIGALLIASAVNGCGSSGGDDKKQPDQTGDKGPTAIAQGANSPEILSPFDAAPDSKGLVIYFTARTKDGVPGVFKVDAPKGSGPAATPSVVAVGDPFVSPFSIAISPDDADLFVADPGATSGDNDTGAIIKLATSGAAPTIMAGTEGTRPKGVETVGGDLWFTGISDKGAGVFKIAMTGGAMSTVAMGDPFRDPSGIAVTKGAIAYVVDTVSPGSSRAVIVRVTAGKAEIIASDIPVGYPAGIALTGDESAVLISGLDKTTSMDAVFRIDLSTNALSSQSKELGIDTFSESAGLHRSHGVGVYAWADSHANGTGTVYVLTAK